MAIPPGSGVTLHDAATELSQSIDTDLIALQEVDVHQDRSGDGNQIKEFAASIGAQYWAFAPAMYGTPGERWHAVNESSQNLRMEVLWQQLISHLCRLRM